MNSTVLSVCGDNQLGPGIVDSPNCRGGFDLTILFEESILVILPTVLFLLASPLRVWYLVRRKGLRITKNAVYVAKLLVAGASLVLQVAILAVSVHSGPQTQATVAAAVLSVLSLLALGPLSHLEHTQSPRPSFLVNGFLLLTVLLDIVRVRTQWLLGQSVALAAILTVSLGFKCALLVLEAVEKRSLLVGLRGLSKEATSGLFSHGTFWWLNSLLVAGSKRTLLLEDLPAIHEKLDSERLGTKFQTAWNGCDRKRRHALALTCTWSLRWELLAIAIPKFCHVALSLSQAYLVQYTVNWFTEVQGPSRDNNTGYGLIGAFAFAYLGLAITTGWSSYLTYRLMTMMRGGLVAMIYAKLLESPASDSDHSASTSLMGTDVPRIAETFHFLLIEVPPAVVQLGVAFYLLYVQLGVVSVAPIVVTLLATGLSAQLARLISPRQKAWVQAIQKRISYTCITLSSMKDIKILGLSQSMTSSMQALREEEMSISKRYRIVQSLDIVLVNIPASFNRFLLFAAYAWAARAQNTGELSVTQAITALAALQLLDGPLSELLSSIPTGWAALGCFERVQEFLMEPGHPEMRSEATPDSTVQCLEPQHGIEMRSTPEIDTTVTVYVEKATIGWPDSHVIHMGDISFSGKALLVAIVGPVGCGKSTFLRALLGEANVLQGSVHVSLSKIAYGGQSPWVFEGSIRDNVLAGSELDESWYTAVVHACALDLDIQNMPEGDSATVGSKGMKLSGGQKQRLSIARALYSRKKLAIVDDVLSGLDSTTENMVFQRVFGPDGLFKKTGTTVILATHSVKHLPQSDLIFALNHQGNVVEKGSFAELNCPGTYVHTLGVQPEDDARPEETTETVKNDIPAPTPTDSGPKAQDSDASRRTGNWSVYKYYALALGPWKLLLFISLTAGHVASSGLGGIWVNWWAASYEDGDGTPGLGYWLGVLASISFLDGVLLAAAIAFLWVIIVPRCGSHLHSSMLQVINRATFGFFTRTETGVLINRFSQDLRLADMALPGSIINVTFQLGGCVVVLALAITAVGLFAVVLPPVMVALYLVQRFYLRTSRQLRLLEIEAAAPLFSHFLESLDGLVTIRSFGWTERHRTKNRRLLDASQRPYYLLLCVQRWLVLVLDLVVAALAVLLVSIAVARRGAQQLSPGFLGLALVHMMSLSHALTDLVQHWAGLETSMGAIVRIRDFAENTPVEKPGPMAERASPPEDWPAHGAVKFENLSATYGRDTAPVLKDVSFSIAAGQKLGLVGRSGSGKSSTILALMRLIDGTDGRILLDGIDLSSVDGSIVRDRLICLTQDPLIFPGSIRENLSPAGHATEDAMATALERVGLWEVLKQKAGEPTACTAALLNTRMDLDTLSHGQRQLFCLARAMLKPGSVLVLDEPTSSVDAHTDAKMQEIIRSEFASHTIIMIAHRLSSLLDFDYVAVLDAGCVVEFGKVDDLVEDAESAFSKLWQDSKHRHERVDDRCLTREEVVHSADGSIR